MKPSVIWAITKPDPGLSNHELIDLTGEQRPLASAYANWSYLPNFKDWARGDFVLFCPHQPVIFQQLIQRWQGPGVAFLDSIWTHVGIYAGDGEVVDAVARGGVDKRPIASWLEEGWVSVRYVPNLDDDSRDAMVTAANECIGQGYTYRKAVSAGFVNALPKWLRSRFNEQDRPELEGRLYCAQVAERSLIAGVNKRIGGADAPMPVPASFSANDLLSWRPLGWRRAI